MRDLRPEEVAILREKFYWVAADERVVPQTTPLADWLDLDTARERIARVTDELGYPNTKLTASTVTKRHSLLTVAAAFFAISVLNVRVDLAPENCWLDLNYAEGPWLAKLPVNAWQGEDLPPVWEEEARRAAVKAAVRELFLQHITPFWSVLREAGRVNAQILWENLAERVYAVYEHKYEDLSLEALVRLKTDFAWILNDLEPADVGLDFNPFQKFNLRDEEGHRIRKTCCLRYQVSHYCHHCPLEKKKR